MKELRAATVKVLHTKTLGELVRRSNEASGYEDAPMYYI